VVGLAVRARKRPLVSGLEAMLGQITRVTILLDDGVVLVSAQGEQWRARSARPLRVGQQVKIVAIDGLTLAVEGVDIETPSSEHIPP